MKMLLRVSMILCVLMHHNCLTRGDIQDGACDKICHGKSDPLNNCRCSWMSDVTYVRAVFLWIAVFGLFLSLATLFLVFLNIKLRELGERQTRIWARKETGSRVISHQHQETRLLQGQHSPRLPCGHTNTRKPRTFDLDKMNKKPASDGERILFVQETVGEYAKDSFVISNKKDGIPPFPWEERFATRKCYQGKPSLSTSLENCMSSEPVSLELEVKEITKHTFCTINTSEKNAMFMTSDLEQLHTYTKQNSNAVPFGPKDIFFKFNCVEDDKEQQKTDLKKVTDQKLCSIKDEKISNDTALAKVSIGREMETNIDGQIYHDLLLENEGNNRYQKCLDISFEQDMPPETVSLDPKVKKIAKHSFCKNNQSEKNMMFMTSDLEQLHRYNKQNRNAVLLRPYDSFFKRNCVENEKEQQQKDLKKFTDPKLCSIKDEKISKDTALDKISIRQEMETHIDDQNYHDLLLHNEGDNRKQSSFNISFDQDMSSEPVCLEPKVKEIVKDTFCAINAEEKNPISVQSRVAQLQRFTPQKGKVEPFRADDILINLICDEDEEEQHQTFLKKVTDPNSFSVNEETILNDASTTKHSCREEIETIIHGEKNIDRDDFLREKERNIQIQPSSEHDISYDSIYLEQEVKGVDKHISFTNNTSEIRPDLEQIQRYTPQNINAVLFRPKDKFFNRICDEDNSERQQTDLEEVTCPKLYRLNKETSSNDTTLLKTLFGKDFESQIDDERNIGLLHEGERINRIQNFRKTSFEDVMSSEQVSLRPEVNEIAKQTFSTKSTLDKGVTLLKPDLGVMQSYTRQNRKMVPHVPNEILFNRLGCEEDNIKRLQTPLKIVDDPILNTVNKETMGHDTAPTKLSCGEEIDKFTIGKRKLDHHEPWREMKRNIQIQPSYRISLEPIYLEQEVKKIAKLTISSNNTSEKNGILTKSDLKQVHRYTTQNRNAVFFRPNDKFLKPKCGEEDKEREHTGLKKVTDLKLCSLNGKTIITDAILAKLSLRKDIKTYIYSLSNLKAFGVVLEREQHESDAELSMFVGETCNCRYFGSFCRCCLEEFWDKCYICVEAIGNFAHELVLYDLVNSNAYLQDLDLHEDVISTLQINAVDDIEKLEGGTMPIVKNSCFEAIIGTCEKETVIAHYIQTNDEHLFFLSGDYKNNIMHKSKQKTWKIRSIKAE